jgi:hypothetical protein
MGCSLRLGYGDVMGMAWREVELWGKELERIVRLEERESKRRK